MARTLTLSRTVSPGTGDGDALTASWHGWLAGLLLLAMATASVVYAVLHGIGAFDESRWYALLQVGMVFGSLALLYGLLASERSPRAGGALVLLTGVALTVLWSFMPPIAVAMLAVTVYGIWRAWRAARRGRAPSSEAAVRAESPAR